MIRNKKHYSFIVSLGKFTYCTSSGESNQAIYLLLRAEIENNIIWVLVDLSFIYYYSICFSPAAINDIRKSLKICLTVCLSVSLSV